MKLNEAYLNANELPKEGDLLVASTKGLPADVYQQMRYIDNLNMDRLRSYFLDMELHEASSKNAREETTVVARGSNISDGPVGGACHNCGTHRHQETLCWKPGGGSAG